MDLMRLKTHFRTEGGKGGKLFGKAGIEFYFVDITD